MPSNETGGAVGVGATGGGADVVHPPIAVIRMTLASLCARSRILILQCLGTRTMSRGSHFLSRDRAQASALADVAAMRCRQQPSTLKKFWDPSRLRRLKDRGRLARTPLG